MMAKIARKSSAFQIANSLLDHWKEDLPPEVIMECAKTMYAQGKDQEAIVRACSIFGEKEHNENNSTIFYDSQGFDQRIYLKIAKWLQNSENIISNETLSKICSFFSEIDTKKKKKTNETENMDDIESRSIVEACLSRAIEGESSCDKTWFSYATYHYQRGRQILEELGSGKTTINLITVSRNKIQEIIINDKDTRNKIQETNDVKDTQNILNDMEVTRLARDKIQTTINDDMNYDNQIEFDLLFKVN
jgi:hypothetical protein